MAEITKGPWLDFERPIVELEERIAGDEADADAAEGFASEFDDLGVDPYAAPRRPEVDVDARLEELKRRMGKD